MRRLYLFFIMLVVVAMACDTTTTATSTPDVNAIVAQTLAAYTVQAALTQAVGPTETLPQPTGTPTTTPQPTETPTTTPEEVAPNPLPMTNTGIILNNGECFNFDNGQVTILDAQCDVFLAEGTLFRQVNGAQLSGYGVSFEPPTRSRCAAGRYEPGDLAIQTDLHMCFISNQGKIGFIVVRAYRGDVPFTGIVFDYWVFR